MKRPLSDDARALLHCIQRHGPLPPEHLRDRFRAQANAAGYGVHKWLLARLGVLENHGLIERLPGAEGALTGWIAVASDVAPAASAKAAGMDRDQVQVAQPRRMSLFEAGTYKPAAVATRPGAMDYAAVPSLHMGQRHPFRSIGE